MHRQCSKLWRKICTEMTIEISLLAENWKHLLAGIFFQYIHGLAAHGVHYIHRPGPTLQDSGYFLLPELGQDKAFISFTDASDNHILFNSAPWSKLSLPCIKQFAWVLAVIQSLLIIASRKHYTVDVVVAWYTVNLVVFFVDKKLPELPDRTSMPLLPLNNKDKDGKNKEEQHNLLNGNAGNTAN